MSFLVDDGEGLGSSSKCTTWQLDNPKYQSVSFIHSFIHSFMEHVFATRQYIHNILQIRVCP